MVSRNVTFTLESGESVTHSYTDKQLAFVEAYLDTFNGTIAAKRAKYKGNDNTLSTVAWENLRKPKIALLVQRRMSVDCMTKTETMKHLASIARGCDITEYLTESTDEDGLTVVSFNITKFRRDGFGPLIRSVTPGRGGLKVEFIDRLGALNSIARHHALFTDVLINATVDQDDKGLLEDDEREQFAASILGRVIKRREQEGN